MNTKEMLEAFKKEFGVRPSLNGEDTDYWQTQQLIWDAKFTGYQAALNSQAKSVPVGIEKCAKYIEKKAEDYATEYGHDDNGGLSFGSGHHAEIKMDYYYGLIELAEELRALPSAAPQPPQVEDRVREAIEQAAKMVSDFALECYDTNATKGDLEVLASEIRAMKEPNTLEGGE